MKWLVILALVLFPTTAIPFLFQPKPQTSQPVAPASTPPAEVKTPPTVPTKTTPPPEPKPKPPVKLPLYVPFTVQAPFGDWQDPRQQDACEEAAVLMAIKWVKGEKIASPASALTEILALSHFQEDKYGQYHDTSTLDTVKRLFNDYYGYTNVAVKSVTNPADITAQLELGNLVITPMNGQALQNPHFTQPGPERHNIVIKGFDQKTKEFITNDPGIRQGENYRYPQDLFFAAIRDYPTGDHLPIKSVQKDMIVIWKN